MPSEPLTLKEKVIILKAALLEIEELLLNTSIPLQQRKDEICNIVDDELNSPSKEDREALFHMRRRILKHHRS
jgi:hypothetical protein